MPKFMRKHLMFFVALALLLAGCRTLPAALTEQPVPTPLPSTATTAPPPSPTTAPSPTLLPTLPQVPVGLYEPSDCPFEVPDGAPIECGFVSVPEDHARLDGPQIRLAVVIIKDQSENHQPDPVILLSGGPGEKTVSSALNAVQLLSHIHPNRDLILFDQRGVGLSEPALECPEWIDAQYDILDEADSMLAAQQTFEKLMACKDKLVAAGYNLAVYNTAQNAADVEAIRQALGYAQVNLAGGSYGSLLAQEVIRTYPEHLRSVVMNSIWPMETSFFIAAPQVTADAVLRLLAACEADTACRTAYPYLTQIFFDVVASLNEDPVIITVTHALTGQDYPVLLTGDRVYSNLVGFLYQTDLLPLLPQAIYAVADGDYEMMAQLQGINLAMYEALSRGMTFSVVCAEDLIGQSEQDLLDSYAALPEALSGRVDIEQMLPYSIFGTCEAWPAAETGADFKQPVSSDLPILMVTGEFDPVTPHQFARQIAAHLPNSQAYEFPGVGHNIMVANDCARQVIGQFISDPAQELDTACLNELTARFVTPYHDPAGRYTLAVPPDWTVSSDPEYTVLTSPDGQVNASVLVVGGEDFATSSTAAWQAVDPDFALPPNVIPRPCAGCAAAGADQFALLTYQPPGNETFYLGAGWLYDGQTYYLLWRANPAALDAWGTDIDLALLGFTINALEAGEK